MIGGRRRPARFALCAIALVLTLAWPATAEPVPDVSGFARATAELDKGRSSAAIDELEQLADRGVVDAAASFNRGFAYAMRVDQGGGQPGDLGRAVQAFEEARRLATTSDLEEDCARAAQAVRTEIARRSAEGTRATTLETRAPALETLTVDAHPNIWIGAALAGVLAVCIGWLFRRRPSARARTAAWIAIATGTLSALIGVAAHEWAESMRRSTREAVVVRSTLRLSDRQGIVIPGSTAVPEGALVRAGESSGAFTRIRWGQSSGWVPTEALRPLVLGAPGEADAP